MSLKRIILVVVGAVIAAPIIYTFFGWLWVAVFIVGVIILPAISSLPHMWSSGGHWLHRARLGVGSGIIGKFLITIAVFATVFLALWWYFPHLFNSYLFWIFALLPVVGAMTAKITGWSHASYVAGALALLLAFDGFSNSGVGRWMGRTYDNVVERCIGEGDCSRRSGDIPNLSGGTLMVSSGKTHVYLVSSESSLKKPFRHCLEIGPKGAFNINDEPYGVIAKVDPKSKQPTLGYFTAHPMASKICQKWKKET